MAKKQEVEVLCPGCKWFRRSKPAVGSEGNQIGTENPICGYFGYWFMMKGNQVDGIPEYELAVECNMFDAIGDLGDIEKVVIGEIKAHEDECHKDEMLGKRLAEELRQAEKKSEPTAGVVYNIENATITEIKHG